MNGQHTSGQQWAQHGDDPTKVTVPDACPFAVQAQTPERAARIVQCVNAHDEMLAALQAARAGIAWLAVNDTTILQQIDAAIAKATGRAHGA